MYWVLTRLQLRPEVSSENWGREQKKKWLSVGGDGRVN